MDNILGLSKEEQLKIGKDFKEKFNKAKPLDAYHIWDMEGLTLSRLAITGPWIEFIILKHENQSRLVKRFIFDIQDDSQWFNIYSEILHIQRIFNFNF